MNLTPTYHENLAGVPPPESGGEQAPVSSQTTPISASAAALSTAAAVAAMTATAQSFQNVPPSNSSVVTPQLTVQQQQHPMSSIAPNCAHKTVGRPTNGNGPQHHLGLSTIHFPPTVYRPPLRQMTPSIFNNMALRRGKWTSVSNYSFIAF